VRLCVLRCVPASLRMQIHFVERLDGVGKVQMWIFGCITWVFCVFEHKREAVSATFAFGCICASLNVTRGADTLCGVAGRRELVCFC